MARNEFSDETRMLAAATLTFGSSGEFSMGYSSGDGTLECLLPDDTLGYTCTTDGEWYFKTLTAGTSGSAVTLTNSTGTIKGAALEDSIAGSGLTLAAGVLSCTVSGGPSTSEYFFADDFIGDSINAVFDTSVSAGSSVQLEHGTYLQGGCVRITSDNDQFDYGILYLGTTSGVVGAAPFAAQTNITAEARVRTDVESGMAYYWGFTEGTVLSGDQMRFQCTTGNSNNWSCYSNYGGSTGSETTNTAITASTWRILKIVQSTGDVKFYIDGTLEATHTQAPQDDMRFLAETYCATTGAAGTGYLTMDYLKITGDRG